MAGAIAQGHAGGAESPSAPVKPEEVGSEQVHSMRGGVKFHWIKPDI